ncbi:MAG: hypothetical protein AAB599_03000 [Patescibacteria group bacterium]
MEPRPSSPEIRTSTGRFLVQIEQTLRAKGVDTNKPDEARALLGNPDFWFGNGAFWNRLSPKQPEVAQQTVCRGILDETQRLGDKHTDVIALQNNLGIGDRKIDLPVLLAATSVGGQRAEPARRPEARRQQESATRWLDMEIRLALKRRGTKSPEGVMATFTDKNFWFGAPESFWDKLASESGTSQTAQEHQLAKCGEVMRDIQENWRGGHSDRVNLRALFGLPLDHKFDQDELVGLTSGGLAPEQGAVVPVEIPAPIVDATPTEPPITQELKPDKPKTEGRWFPLRRALDFLRGEPQSPAISASEARKQAGGGLRDFMLPPLRPAPDFQEEKRQKQEPSAETSQADPELESAMAEMRAKAEEQDRKMKEKRPQGMSETEQNGRQKERRAKD